jgi:trehalose-6-phosphatase
MSNGAGETAKDPSAWTPDLILALMEEQDRRYTERWEAHKAVHTQEAESRLRQADTIEGRLQALNELRAEVVSDRGLLVRRETLDAKLEAIDTRIDALHDQHVEWRGREKGLLLIVGGAAFVSTIMAILGFMN